jgi:tRNA pseudouridine55 synthase
MELVDGVIVVDKPSGWTSHDVVNRMRRLAGTKKVGHLGTLDPLATGVLPVVIGKATRLQQFFVKNDKVYEGVIRFGYATDSYDRDGLAKTLLLPLSNSNHCWMRFGGHLSRFRRQFRPRRSGARSPMNWLARTSWWS